MRSIRTSGLTTANGLEGGLFAFLLVRSIGAIVSGASPYLISVWGGLLFLTRPDSLAVIPLGGIYQFVSEENRGLPLRQIIRRRALPMLVRWLTVVVGATAWRLWYFGAWLPNTIVARPAPGNNLGQLLENVTYGRHYWPDFLGSAPLLAFGTALSSLLAPRRPVVWLCLVTLVVQIPVVLIDGGDWMPHWRLLVVNAPVMTILLGIALQRVLTVSSKIATRSRSIATVGVAIVLFAGIRPMLRSNDWLVSPTIQVHERSDYWRALATILHPVLVPTDRVGLEVLGVFSYVNPDIYSFDLLGLTNAYEARNGTVYLRTAGKFDPAYTYRVVRPDLNATLSSPFYLK